MDKVSMEKGSMEKGSMKAKALALCSHPLVRQFGKFGVVGVVGFTVDTSLVYAAIYALHIERVAAGFLAFPFAVTVTWLGNRLFTFRHAQHQPMLQQLAKFALVCAVGLVFNRGTYAFLVSTVPLVYDHPVLGLLAGTGVGMFFNFFAARAVVFGHRGVSA